MLWVLSAVLLVAAARSAFVALALTSNESRRVYAWRLFRFSVYGICIANGVGPAAAKIADVASQIW